MDSILLLLSDYTFQMVVLGSSFLGIISGVLGCFMVLRKQSLLGDGVAHAALPGILLIFLLTGSNHTELLLLGAFLTSLFATRILLFITKYSKITFDSALAITLSVFFGFAMVLLTITQKTPNANQAGLDRFIYGQASALLYRDLILIISCGSFLLICMILFWKEFKLLCFDPLFAQSIGIPITTLSFLLTFLMVMAIIMGLQTVGVILMSSMLIAPAVSARQWVSQLYSMVLLSGFFGGISGVIGTSLSSLLPQMPTGPVIVICMSIISIFSFLLAPRNGIVMKLYRRYLQKQLLQTSNIDPSHSRKEFH